MAVLTVAVDAVVIVFAAVAVLADLTSLAVLFVAVGRHVSFDCVRRSIGDLVLYCLLSL